MYDFRKHFPILSKKINEKPLVYLDNASTTPKPTEVITAISDYYSNMTANPGRGSHTLSANAQQAVEDCRNEVLSFLDAPSSYTTVFTKSATESINLVASAVFSQYRTSAKKPHIIITRAEHHSNYLPWLKLHNDFNFPLTIINVKPNGEIDYEQLRTELSKNKDGILAITHCSNVTGIVTKLDEIIELAKERNFQVLLDASQSIPHIQISLKSLPVDYLVASVHKMYGPEGVGLLVLHNRLLSKMEPLLLGGGTVESVSNTNYKLFENEARLEAGTKNTAGIIATTTTIRFINQMRQNGAIEKEEELTKYFIENIHSLETLGFKLLTENPDNISVPIFTLTSNIHPHDISDYLDSEGIAIRAGNMCAIPLHSALNCSSSIRISLSFYNTTEEIDSLFNALSKCKMKFG